MTLKEARHNARMTQMELAIETGLSIETIKNAESGKSVSWNTQKCIESALCVKIDWEA